MKRLRPAAGHLAVLAAGLAAVALFAWFYTRHDPTAGAVGLIGLLALMVLLELPAFWWRREGGWALGTFVVAVAGPLIVFEALLAFSASGHDHDSGGDLQGIEQWLMVAVIVPILITGGIVAAVACAMVEPRDPWD
jgi:hypothetical protein